MHYVLLAQVERPDKGIPAILDIRSVQEQMLHKQDQMFGKQDPIKDKFTFYDQI